MKDMLFIGLALCLLSTGCGGSSIMPYDPQPYDRDRNPKETIKRIIESQPGKNAPAGVEVTDEYIKVLSYPMGRRSRVGVVTGSVAISRSDNNPGATANMIYYQYIGNVDLYSRRDYYVVMIYDRGGGLQYRG